MRVPRHQAVGVGSHFGATEDLLVLARARHFIDWIASELEPALGATVLEVGAGCGAFTARFVAAGNPARTVMAIEPAANLILELRARSAAFSNVEVRQATSTDLVADGFAEHFDSVIYVNVLEHIDDHEAELRTAASLVKPGGTVGVVVPALPSLYGSVDYTSGHHRRYRRESLESVFRSAGLDVVSIRYLDVLGIAPYWLMYRVFRVPRVDGVTSWLYDSLLVPTSRTFERLVGSPPRGKNLIGLARRPPLSGSQS